MLSSTFAALLCLISQLNCTPHIFLPDDGMRLSKCQFARIQNMFDVLRVLSQRLRYSLCYDQLCMPIGQVGIQTLY